MTDWVAPQSGWYQWGDPPRKLSDDEVAELDDLVIAGATLVRFNTSALGTAAYAESVIILPNGQVIPPHTETVVTDRTPS